MTETRALTRLRAMVARGEQPDTVTLLEMRAAEPQLLPGLVGAPAEPRVEARLACLATVVELGRPLVGRGEYAPLVPAPFVSDPVAVTYLVQSLGDGEARVRDAAAMALTNDVPERFARDHVREIVVAVRANPTVESGALLLGKLGSFTAELALRTLEPLREASAEATQSALARLGDRDAEHAALQAYVDAGDLDDRRHAAMRLGYVATPLAISTLARDLRTPETYRWNRNARRSLRVDLVAALSLALPLEVVFWRPVFKPENDAYWEAVEGWCVANLGVRYELPRPPFLYEEDAPIV